MTHYSANRFKPLLPCAVLLAMLFSLFLMPQMAWASGSTTIASASGQFQFAQDDYFINVILKGILGNIINPTSASAGQTVSGSGTLGEVFRTFNMGIAFFGSVIVVFITMVGVLQSGNDGEFLGRKWSSMWVPVRFATGSALMLPLTSSGYSYCQAIVLWIASQGVGFADTLWTTIVNQIGIKNGITLTAQVDVGSVVRSVAMAELCTAALNRIESNAAAAGGGASNVSYGFRMNDVTANDVRTINAKWGNTNSLADTSTGGACGTINYAYNEDTNRLSDPYVLIRKNVADTHLQQIEALSNDYRARSEAIVAKYFATDGSNSANYDPTPDLNQFLSRIEADTRAYTQVMSTAVSNGLSNSGYKNNTTPNTSEMTKYGFAMAGMWYIELLKVHNTARHSLTPPNIQGMQVAELTNNPGYAAFQDVIDSAKKLITSGTSKNAGTYDTSSSTGSASGTTIRTTVTNFNISVDSVMERGLFDGVFVTMSNWLRETIFGVGQSSNGTANTVWTTFGSNARDPNVSTILQLKDKGDSILNVTGVLMSLDIASKMTVGVTEAADKSGAPGSLFNSATGLFAGIAKAAAYTIDKLSGYTIGAAVGLFMFGIALSVYVPMIPYVLWVGALMGLTILILESLVAIMLWAVMMMHPSGDGITSDYNRQGLNMLLAVFTRPALLLMGMVLGMFMVEPMVMFINDTFQVVMSSVQGNTITGLFSTIAFIAIYASLIMMIVEKSFAMIHVVPDRVLTWIGGPGALTGEERDIVGKGQQQLNVVGQGMNSILLGRGMQGKGSKSPGLKQVPKSQWKD